MAKPLLSVTDLNVTFRGAQDVHAVRGVSYDVNEGEFLGIVGESGSGKSVSSLAIMGLLPSKARVTGSIQFDGKELVGQSDKALSRLRGSDIAMVFQDPLSALTPVYSIGNQITEALKLHDRKLSDAAANARAAELLRLVGIPNVQRQLTAFTHEFSGGMRQRVMIAIAIANNPRLIIAEEPTTALDVTIQAQILDLLQTARDITGAAVVLITHDLGVVAGNADRVAVMYAGRIVEQAPVIDLFASPVMPYTVGLLRSMPSLTSDRSQRLVPLEGRPPLLVDLPQACPFAPRCPAATDLCRSVEPPLAPIGEGRLAACHRADEILAGTLERSEIFPRPEEVVDAPVALETLTGNAIELDNVYRTYPLFKGSVFRRRVGEVHAVAGISFAVKQGTTLGLVGESGCGKTTTIMQILELNGAETGTIKVADKDTSGLTKAERRAMRSDIQVVFQDPMASLDPRMRVDDIISEPLTVHGVSREEARTTVEDLLELVGLERSFADRYPHEFSGGQRQRIGIARALIVNPKIVVLDEPVSALDVSVQAGVINLLEDLKARLGLSYLFVAHDLAVIRQIADDVAVMYLGRVVEYGSSEEIFSNPRHPYTRALLSAVPVPDPTVESSRARILLEGDLPSPADRRTGCNFRSRCPLFKLMDEEKQARCASTDPEPREVAGRRVECHWAEETELISA